MNCMRIKLVDDVAAASALIEKARVVVAQLEIKVCEYDNITSTSFY